MWLFCFLILFMSLFFFFFKCRYVGLCFEHLTSHCTLWCWILCFFCALEDGSIGPEMELKRFRHYPEKQNQSQGTPSDKHLLKPRVIYWFNWHAVHPLSIKRMWQISQAEQITSSNVCMHSARIYNQIFMNFFFLVCIFFFLRILNMGVCKYLFVWRDAQTCSSFMILSLSSFRMLQICRRSLHSFTFRSLQTAEDKKNLLA